ncbi:histidinol-phosphate aminotransferase [Roseobacter sp. SK209-2-6]|uniref:hypothetical protein n=1 Tax=Roseobacter sp. SK209-2-6 TaxID=388739 RepID=UPI0000F3EB4C|nr:hypothetical protein [Roseobacter sp. SK209-2-6]EBA15511.1 histidinol-phosphate aminotransferase [Roseobacter sp. SK209-2-6]
MDYHNHNHRQATKQPEEATDLFSAAIAFLGINLLWIFFAIWVLFGMVPVLLLALFLNHMIDRIEARMLESES